MVLRQSPNLCVLDLAICNTCLDYACIHPHHEYADIHLSAHSIGERLMENSWVILLGNFAEHR